MVQLPLFSEKGVYKFFSIENLEILHSFSQADVLDRDTEMIRNTDHDATFGRSVQFGNRQSIHLGCSRKLLGLFKCVLSGRTVQYQQDSCGASGTTFFITFLILVSSFIRLILLCRRPAVSIITTSAPFAFAELTCQMPPKQGRNPSSASR